MTRLPYAPLLLLALLACVPRLAANSDVRNWILADGKIVRAELLSYDEKNDRVVLRFDGKTERVYTYADFGVMDQAWLAEWNEIADDHEALAHTLGGRYEQLRTTGEQPTDLFLYTPSAALAADAPPPPALILFHPGGKASRHVRSHMEAAEKSGLLLIGCGQFQNTYDEPTSDRMLVRFREVFPQILARVRLDPARLYLGGTSGGAARAYHYTAQVPHPWAGVYANAGWLNGREYYTLPFPSGMRVAMVNGNLDTPASKWVQPDGEILRRAGNHVGVFAFEGGHQVPPPLHQFIAFEWLLGRDTDPRATP